MVCFKAGGVTLALAGHRLAGALVFFAPDPWVALQFVMARAQAFGPAVTSFRTDRREVWLTIDDGPDPASTPRVLELLREHRARATFFLIGERVTRHPELARRIVAEGHTIGNHTLTHPASTFWRASPARIAAEIDGCTGALILANAPFEHYFRPPVGIRNFFLNSQLTARGMMLVLWNARGLDGGNAEPVDALARIAPQIQPGSILVSHEGGVRADRRLDYLERLLGFLGEQRYACVLPERGALLHEGLWAYSTNTPKLGA